MKFICENCKAKYQIGDDKIAGRSVRMKCRRCGHLIQLNASVTDPSSHPDGAGADLESSFVETGSSASRPLAAMLGVQPHEAMSQLREEPEDDPTRAMTREQRQALGVKEPHVSPPTQQTPRTATPAPAAARPAFGAAGASAAPHAAGHAPPGGSGIVARGVPAPGAARPLGGGLGAARPAPAVGAARPLGAARPAPAAGVAGAFQKTLAEGTAPSDPPKTPAAHVPHGEDWYVGVGGVPLGPVRLAVIREKAIAGSVHADSLVWREGFDEWQPLKNFPELLQIVEEAQAARSGGRRPSVLPPRAQPPAPAAVKAPAAPSPYQAKPPTPGAYQPKVTQVGVGIPAASLPGTAPKVPITAPVPATAPVAAPAPVAARPVPGRSALTPPAPAGRSSSVPHEPARSSDVGAPPVARGSSVPHEPRASALEARGSSVPHEPRGLIPHARHEVAPHSSTAVSPAPAPTPAPAASFDLFGGVSPPAPAPTPVPAVATVVPAPAPTPVPAAAPVVPAPAPTPAGASDPVASGVAASAALDVMKDPFAAPAPAPMPAGSNGRSSLASIETVAPQPPPSEAPLSIAGLATRRRGGMHPVFYAFIAMAASFGGVVAYVLFSRPPQQIIVYQPMPGSSTGAPVSGTAVPGDTAVVAPPATDTPTADPSSSVPRPQGGGSSGGGASTKPTSSGTSAPLDTSGFGNQVVPPPVATATATGPDPSLGQLSQGEIQGVVAANQARVKKRCWQPALDAAGPNASPNARVSGKIVIGPSGSVDSASASGAEKDYPGLSSCIAGQMKGWKFPPSGGSTPVNVPFVFAGQ